MSRKAQRLLSAVIGDSAEFLELDGLGGEYVGFHCVEWIDCSDAEHLKSEYGSIHSAEFIPSLCLSKIEGRDLFGHPAMLTKLFVSSRFKEIVDLEGISGAQFIAVSLY